MGSTIRVYKLGNFQGYLVDADGSQLHTNTTLACAKTFQSEEARQNEKFRLKSKFPSLDFT